MRPQKPSSGAFTVFPLLGRVAHILRCARPAQERIAQEVREVALVGVLRHRASRPPSSARRRRRLLQPPATDFGACGCRADPAFPPEWPRCPTRAPASRYVDAGGASGGHQCQGRRPPSGLWPRGHPPPLSIPLSDNRKPPEKSNKRTSELRLAHRPKTERMVVPTHETQWTLRSTDRHQAPRGRRAPALVKETWSPLFSLRLREGQLDAISVAELPQMSADHIERRDPGGEVLWGKSDATLQHCNRLLTRGRHRAYLQADLRRVGRVAPSAPAPPRPGAPGGAPGSRARCRVRQHRRPPR